VTKEKELFYKSVGKSAEWYTPSYILDAVRDVMGRIDLDPASCEHAQRTVNARVWFTKERSGLDFQWRGKVFLNPPYSRKQVGIWVRKLKKEWEEQNIDEAILLVNNATDTAWFQNLWDFSVCFVTGRISFENPHRESFSPAHGSVFVYFGKNSAKFAKVFTRFGPVFERVGDGLRKYKPKTQLNPKEKKRG
tara:strand:- start:582 stop:1157 length:576 start_codon:yes stop_codon:yes gene_type:complete